EGRSLGPVHRRELRDRSCGDRRKDREGAERRAYRVEAGLRDPPQQAAHVARDEVRAAGTPRPNKATGQIGEKPPATQVTGLICYQSPRSEPNFSIDTFFALRR